MEQIVLILFGFVLALSTGANIGSQKSIFNQNTGLVEQFENILTLSLIKGIERRGQSSNLLVPVLPKLPDPYKVEDGFYTFNSKNLIGTMSTCESVLTGASTIKDDLSFEFGIPSDVKFDVNIEVLHLVGKHDADLTIVDGETQEIVSRGDYSIEIKGAKVDVVFKVLVYPNGVFDIQSASVNFLFDSLAMKTTETLVNGEPIDWEAFNEGIKDLFDQLWPRMKPGIDKNIYVLAVDLFSECNVNTLLAGDLSCIRKSGKSSVGNQVSHQHNNLVNTNLPTCPAQPTPPPDDSYIIQSDNPTNDGKWASGLERCPEGSFVNGFQVKTEEYQFGDDDTAMNGLRLFCSNTDVSITSLEGGWGDYGKTYKCPDDEQSKGFQLRVEGSGEPDETATNNIRMICSGGKSIEGDGLNFGSWRDTFTCKDNFAACGLRTQIQPDQSASKDDIALNNIAVLCCSVI